MTKNELRERLVRESIPPDTYNLEGGLPNEAYCLNQDKNIWEVYYSERGQKSMLKQFEFENEACDYFYKLLIQMLIDMDIVKNNLSESV